MNTSDFHLHSRFVEMSAHISTRFDSLQKFSKIAYRLIDIGETFRGVASSFSLLSTHIKDLVMIIESTRFFVIAPPLLLRDKNGENFFSKNNHIKNIEKSSIITHTALKTIQGADRIDLLQLGRLGSYSFANMPIFKWAIEGTILMFYLFGTIDSVCELTHLDKISNQVQRAILELESAKIDSLERKKAFCEKKIERANLQINQTRAWLKVASNVTKIILIVFAVIITALNQFTFPLHIFLLSWGTLTDVIGLARIFYIEYKPLSNFEVLL